MKFQPRSENTRKFIIETAASLFNQQGYANTAMSDITAATGLTKGSIYGNFENKEEMVMATFDYIADLRRQKMSRFVAQGKSYADKLYRHALSATRVEGRAFEFGGCPLLNAGMEADDTNEQLRQKVAAEFSSWKKELVTLIKQGITAGEFKPELNVMELTEVLISLTEGGVAVYQITKEVSYMKSILKTIQDIIGKMQVSE